MWKIYKISSSIDEIRFNEEVKESVGLEYEISQDASYYVVKGIGDCKDKDIIIP